MTRTTMLSGHVKEALERAESSEGEYLIAPQDTTYYNYSGQSQMSGLGKIQGKIKGVMQYDVLLLNEKGLPLGILAQQYWTRHGGMDWPEGEKESQKWFNGLHATNEKSKNSHKRWVSVADREGDIFEFFKAEREPNVDLLVRVFQARRVEVASTGIVCPLPEIVSQLSTYGLHTVRIFRGNREVELTLSLEAATVHIHPGKGQSVAKHKTGLNRILCKGTKIQSKGGIPK